MLRYALLLVVAFSAPAATVTLSGGAGSCAYTSITITPDGNVTAQCVKKCAELVTGLYREILKREPDAGGLEYWTGACNAGMSEQQLRVEFEPYRPR